mmetsp:Transcript_85660/g.171467  ORF Transcript_85660/g.171467 Transcript_85660/m.171467 type:complete len:411 (+) Transcript_85660:1469-2701(+)
MTSSLDLSATMTKLVLAVKVANQIRCLLDLAGGSGVGAEKKLVHSNFNGNFNVSDSGGGSGGGGKRSGAASPAAAAAVFPSGDDSTTTSTPTPSVPPPVVTADGFLVGGRCELSEETTTLLLRALFEVAAHARAVNTNLPLRKALWRCGFMDLPPTRLVDSRGDPLPGPPLRLLPHVLEQEAAATRHLLAVLFRMYTGHDADGNGSSSRNRNGTATGGGDGETQTAAQPQPPPPAPPPSAPPPSSWGAAAAEGLLVEVCGLVLDRFLVVEKAFDDAAHAPADTTPLQEVRAWDYEVRCLVPATAHVLRGLLRFTDDQFLRHRSWVYPSLARLSASSSRLVRGLVRNLLTGPVQRLFVFGPSPPPSLPSLPLPPLTTSPASSLRAATTGPPGLPLLLGGREGGSVDGEEKD